MHITLSMCDCPSQERQAPDHGGHCLKNRQDCDDGLSLVFRLLVQHLMPSHEIIHPGLCYFSAVKYQDQQSVLVRDTMQVGNVVSQSLAALARGLNCAAGASIFR